MSWSTSEVGRANTTGGLGMAEGKLIRVRPYHAGGPLAPQVWHDRSDCEQGRWIPSEALRPGAGSRTRCPECIRLDTADPTEPTVARAEDPRRNPRPPTGRKHEQEKVKERRRLRLDTLIGVGATGGLLVLGALWLTGGFEGGRDRVAANVASAVPSSTTSTTKPVAPSVVAALAALAKASPARAAAIPGSVGFSAPLPDRAPSAAAPSAGAPRQANAGASPTGALGGRDPAAVAAARAERRAARQAARANGQR